MRSFVASFAAAVALLAAPAHAQAPAWQAGTDGLRPVPALSARVTDLTNTLSADERARLESKLASFEDKNGAQMAVLIVPTTQPEPVEAYALRVADAWKVGRKGRDDGVLPRGQGSGMRAEPRGLGTGPGRGMGLMFVVLGVLVLIAVRIAISMSRLLAPAMLARAEINCETSAYPSAATVRSLAREIEIICVNSRAAEGCFSRCSRKFVEIGSFKAPDAEASCPI